MAEFAPTIDRIDSDVFLVLAFDGEGSAARRDEALAGHLAYVEQHCDDYLVCGPLREPGQTDLMGSFFLVAAADEHEVRALVNGDPYVKSGMYADIRVLSATASAGRFMGGVIWESAESVRAAMAN